MAVNGIRVSALPVMAVADLTDGDYLIVNDENTNTKRISFADFYSSVNTNLHEVNVTSVNGDSGAVQVTPLNIGAATTQDIEDLILVLADKAAITYVDSQDGIFDELAKGYDEVVLADAKNYTENALTAYTPSADLSTVATSGLYTDLVGAPAVDSFFATSVQGTKADTALQDGSLYATAAQGTLATDALPAADVGTAAAKDVDDFATGAEGDLAVAALPSSSVSTFGGTLIDDADAAAARNTLGLGDVSTTAAADYATAAQGATAVTAVQPAAGAITVTTLADDADGATIAAAFNTLNTQLAAILNS